ncbi:hypothetical protein KJ612_08840 [Myxococcota bacterium]|nr:hypothetical protein [Myxococcota bacterium]
MNRFAFFLLFLAGGLFQFRAATLAGAEEPANPYAKKEILVFTPTWSDPDAVMPFLQEKVENLMLESPGKGGWQFLQVGYIPLFLRTHIKKTENNYGFILTVSLRNGEELFKLEDVCEICNTTEALEKLTALKDQISDRLDEKATEAARLEAEAARNRPPVKPKKDIAEIRILATLSEPAPFTMPPFHEAPRPVELWSWMGASLSLAALVTGIVLLAMDDGTTCDAPYPEKQCPEKYATGAAGWTFLLGGLAGGGLAGWSLYNIYYKKPSVVPQVVPTAGPGKAGLMLEWKF